MLFSSSLMELPMEILFDVLSRLPVKTLLISTCVCKSWCTMIKSHDFIKTHLYFSFSHKENDHNKIIIMPKEMDTYGGVYLVPTFTSLFDDHQRFYKLVYRYVDIETEYMSRFLVNSVNGLLCLAFHPYPCVDIVNPSIRRGRTVTSSVVFPKFDAMSFEVEEVVMGFGWVKESDDYKVVRIFYFRNDSSGGGCLGQRRLPQVEVYSLRADSWSLVDVEVDFFAYRESVVFVNGSVYWMAKEYDAIGNVSDNKECKFVVSFNVVDESFRRIKVPDNCMDGYYDRGTLLMNYRGSLSLVVYFTNVENACEYFHTIWVMSNTGFWRKQFSFVISVSGSVHRPLGCTYNDELIVEMGNGELFAYDLNRVPLERMKLKGPRIEASPYVVEANYMESLVLLEERDVDLVVEN